MLSIRNATLSHPGQTKDSRLRRFYQSLPGVQGAKLNAAMDSAHEVVMAEAYETGTLLDPDERRNGQGCDVCLLLQTAKGGEIRKG